MSYFSCFGKKHKLVLSYCSVFISIPLLSHYKRKYDSAELSHSRSYDTYAVVSCDRGQLDAVEKTKSFDHDQYSYDNSEDDQTITNWSSTHSCTPDHIYYPKSASEVLSILQKHHFSKSRIRPIGNALSPNGIGMCDKKDSTCENSSNTTALSADAISSQSKLSSDRSLMRMNKPNQIEKNENNLINVSLIDYVHVNKSNLTVNVGAGATVATVLKELKKHGLTLQNFSSIQEQQIGGWTQIAAHGTGCQFSTVDEMITDIQIVSPSQGIMNVLPTHHPANVKSSSFQSSLISNIHTDAALTASSRTIVSDELFNMVKVGLGSLGVVTELTLKCIPELQLHEKTSHIDRSALFASKEGIHNHSARLNNFRHVRYMWLPYTDSVISVTSKPVSAGVSVTPQAAVAVTGEVAEKPTKAFCNLVKKLYFTPEISSDSGSSSIEHEHHPHPSVSTLERLSFTQLRDLLLDIKVIKSVNEAESSYWKAIADSKELSTRVENSNNILGFDCGGEQWVYEVCIPMGKFSDTHKISKSQQHQQLPKDLEFMQKLMSLIESSNIPAPCPIEQRWTCGSSAYMSPAYSAVSSKSSGHKPSDELFTWVGIIMYLPLSQTTEQRKVITKRFHEYTELITPLVQEYKGYPHWAKLEIPQQRHNSVSTVDTEKLLELKKYLRLKYPVNEFNRTRKIMDPHGILSNTFIDSLFDDNPSS